MQRSGFDAGSIAALLRQTEANISALKTPQEADRKLHSATAGFGGLHSGFSLGGASVAGPAATPVPAPAPGPWPAASVGVGAECYGAARRPGIGVSVPAGCGGSIELEAQVLQLRNAVETLERRLEDDLRAFLGVCDKRLQAKEEQLRSVGESMQVTADSVAEGLCRRVDARLRDLERASSERTERSLEEVWESLRRLQSDGRGVDGRLQRCATSDELGDRFREMERSLTQRLEEKVVNQERRAVELRAQLESASEAWREAISQRCHALESRVWENQQDRGDLADVVLKRLPETASFRELQDEVRQQTYAGEVQQRRLSACEAKLSKLPALESKVEFSESQTAQQLEEQAQAARGLNDVAQRLMQKIASSEVALQRVEAQNATLESRLQQKSTEEVDRIAGDLDALQQRLLKRVDDVENRLQRSASQVERELTQQFSALALKTSEDQGELQQQMERRLGENQVRVDNFVQDIERRLRVVREHTDAAMRDSRNADEAAGRLAAEFHANLQGHKDSLMKHREELHRSHEAFIETHKSRMDILHTRTEAVEVAAESSKARTDSLHSKSTDIEVRMESVLSRVADIEASSKRTSTQIESVRSSMSASEDHARARAAELIHDVEALRVRTDTVHASLADVQADFARAQRGLETVRGSVAALEGVKTQVSGLDARIGAIEVRADASQAKMTDAVSNAERLQSGLESLRASLNTQVARIEEQQVGMSSLDVLVHTLQESIVGIREQRLEASEGVASVGGQAAAGASAAGAGSPSAQIAAVRELVAAGEARAMERSERQMREIRQELATLRSDHTTVRLDGQASDARAADQLKRMEERLSACLAREGELAARTGEHAALLAQVRETVAELGNARPMASPKASAIVHQAAPSSPGASRQTLPEGRDRTLISQLEDAVRQGQSGLAALEGRTGSLEEQVRRLVQGVVQETVPASPSGLKSSGASPSGYRSGPQSPSRGHVGHEDGPSATVESVSALELRVSRLEANASSSSGHGEVVGDLDAVFAHRMGDIGARVDDLERSFAEGLEQVESRVLTVEKMYRGAIGVGMDAELPIAEEMLDGNDQSRHRRLSEEDIDFASSWHGPGAEMEASSAGGISRKASPSRRGAEPRSGLQAEDGDSSQDIVFDQSFDATNAEAPSSHHAKGNGERVAAGLDVARGSQKIAPVESMSQPPPVASLDVSTISQKRSEQGEESNDKRKGNIDADEASVHDTKAALSSDQPPQGAVPLDAAERRSGKCSLELRIVAAYCLRNRDSGVFGDVSDPFVVAQLGPTQYKTEVVKNNLNPVWKPQTFCFELSEDVATHNTLRLEVLDFNNFHSHLSLGTLQVVLACLTPNQCERRRARLENGENGELEYEVLYNSPASGDAAKAGGDIKQVEQPLYGKSAVTANVSKKDDGGGVEPAKDSSSSQDEKSKYVGWDSLVTDQLDESNLEASIIGKTETACASQGERSATAPDAGMEVVPEQKTENGDELIAQSPACSVEEEKQSDVGGNQAKACESKQEAEKVETAQDGKDEQPSECHELDSDTFDDIPLPVAEDGVAQNCTDEGASAIQVESGIADASHDGATQGQAVETDTARVTGSMTAVDDDSSDDGLPPPVAAASTSGFGEAPSSGAATNSAPAIVGSMAAADDSSDDDEFPTHTAKTQNLTQGGATSSSATPAASQKTAADVRALLGEDSSDSGEGPAPQVPLPSQGLKSTLQMPQSFHTSTSMDAAEIEDSDDAEDALESLLAAGPARGGLSRGRGLGGGRGAQRGTGRAGAGSSLSMVLGGSSRPNVASSSQLAAPASPERASASREDRGDASVDSWDESSVGSPSPSAKEALGLNSPSGPSLSVVREQANNDDSDAASVDKANAGNIATATSTEQQTPAVTSQKLEEAASVGGPSDEDSDMEFGDDDDLPGL
eukprot:TRINITY_DN28958_c0_g6_i1.p1 TRINITY_DN28958_c0_g6~~TRINITY_DN28958_c0_g6_i1.p1  ORF type:complete len:1915 (-),score=329.08 TRINITY_DN28958_c0_g6_i1:299-6043(-)